MNHEANTSHYPEIAAALKDVKSYFIYAGIFSAAVNMLMLVPVIYMLQVFNRVISSGSLSTLASLTLLMVALLMAVGGFEWVRSMILISASNRIEKNLRKRVSDATFKRALLSGGMVSTAQPLSDLSGLRQFLTGSGLFAFFDAPWFPIYVAVMFMFHPWFGVAAILAGIVMVLLAYANEKVTGKKMKDANSQANQVSAQVNGSLRNAEVIAAMGMADDIRRRQEHNSDKVLLLQTDASKWAGVLTSLSKSFRMIVQSLLLGMGALLVLRGELSPGLMIAGSLLLGRALAPIDMLVGTWKGFVVARAQYDRLGQLLQQIPKEPDTMSLPPPQGRLTAEQVMVVPPGSQTIVVKAVSLDLQPGEALGIVGPSASGKSSLARALLGIWPTHSGQVRLDGASHLAEGGPDADVGHGVAGLAIDPSDGAVHPVGRQCEVGRDVEVGGGEAQRPASLFAHDDRAGEPIRPSQERGRRLHVALAQGLPDGGAAHDGAGPGQRRYLGDLETKLTAQRFEHRHRALPAFPQGEIGADNQTAHAQPVGERGDEVPR